MAVSLNLCTTKSVKTTRRSHVPTYRPRLSVSGSVYLVRVLQFACLAAADITPRYPGDPDRLKDTQLPAVPLLAQ